MSLVTPEGPAFDGDVEMMVVPGADGEIGVLARHAPLVALLKAGSTRIYRGPIERLSGGDPERLRLQVRRTVFHEIAHHFGISDERLVEIDRY